MPEDNIIEIVKRVITGDSENIVERVGHEALEFVVYGELYGRFKKILSDII